MIGLGGSLTSGVPESKYSAVFDGTDDYIDTGHHFSDVFNDSFTISLWVKPDDGQPSSSEFLFGNLTADDACRLELNTNGKLELIFESNTDGAIWMSDVVNFSDGAATSWTHILITLTKPGSGNSAGALYINGSSVTFNNTATISHSNHALFSIDKNFYIGAYNNNGSAAKFFDGGIDEFAIWDVALDADAVTAIYNSGSPLNLKFDQGNYDNSSSLQVYYKMGNGLFDDKANGAVHDQVNPGYGTDLVTNGTMEVDSNWNDYNSVASNIRSNWEHSGSYSRKFTVDGASQGIKSDAYTSVTGTVYLVSLWVYPDDGTDIRVAIRKGDNSGWANDTGAVTVTQDAWNNIKFYYTEAAGGSGAYIVIHGSGETSGDFYIDDVSIKQLNGKPGVTYGGVTFSSDTP